MATGGTNTTPNGTTKTFLGLAIKDWAILIIPILFNAITLLMLQPAITQYYYRIEIRNSVYKEFWETSKHFNDVLIEVNVKNQKEPETIPEIVDQFYDELVTIQQYYDTNLYDLEVFESEYQNLLDKWEDFIETVGKYNGKSINSDDAIELGNALEKVKQANIKLSSAIRDEL